MVSIIFWTKIALPVPSSVGRAWISSVWLMGILGIGINPEKRIAIVTIRAIAKDNRLFSKNVSTR